MARNPVVTLPVRGGLVYPPPDYGGLVSAPILNSVEPTPCAFKARSSKTVQLPPCSLDNLLLEPQTTLRFPTPETPHGNCLQPTVPVKHDDLQRPQPRHQAVEWRSRSENGTEKRALSVASKYLIHKIREHSKTVAVLWHLDWSWLVTQRVATRAKSWHLCSTDCQPGDALSTAPAPSQVLFPCEIDSTTLPALRMRKLRPKEF